VGLVHRLDRTTLIHFEQQARSAVQRLGAWGISADSARMLGVVVAAGFVLRLLLLAAYPDSGFRADLATFADWGKDLATFGPGAFYRPDSGHFADYPPVYMFILWLSAAATGFANLSPVQLLAAIKLPLIAADLCGGVALYVLGRQLAGARAGLIAAAAFLFNPGVIFDSTIWGQNDSLAVLPVLVGLVFLARGWTEAAAAASVVGLLTKFQFGFLVPIVAVTAIRRHLVGGRGRLSQWQPEPRRLAGSLVAAIGIALVVMWPFGLSLYAAGDVAHSLWHRFLGATGAFTGVTQNAFNLWMNPLTDVVIRGSRGTTEGHVVSDSVRLISLGSFEVTWQLIGNALFLGILLIAAALVWRRFDDRWSPVFAALLVAFAFFMLPTRVHERYLFPAIAIGAVFVIRGGRWPLWYAFLSLVFLLNLYWVYTLPLGNASFERTALLDATLLSALGIYALSLGAIVAFAWLLLKTYQFAVAERDEVDFALTWRRLPGSRLAQPAVARAPEWSERANTIVRGLPGIRPDATVATLLRSRRGMAVVLLLSSVLAAFVVARVGWASGPWLWNPDMPKIDYPWASLFHEALASGRLPLWGDRLGLGFPLYAEGQIGAFYPPNWLIFQLPPLVALDVTRVLHLTLAGVGTGLIALRLTGSRLGAVVAAATAVMCGGIVTKLEWTNAVVAYGWLPWVLLPLVRRPRPTTVGLLASAVAWGIQALAGFPNLWVLTGLVAVVVMAATSPRIATARRVMGWGLLGAALGAVQLIPTLLLTTLSVRSGGLSMDDLFNSAATPFDPLSFGFANAFVRTDTSGWAAQTIWYPDGVFALFEAGAYLALPVLGLAAIGAGARRARPWIAVVVVMVGVAIVAAFRPEIWAHLPILSSMRSPARAYLFADFALALLAAVGVSRLARDARGPSRSTIVIGTLVIVYALFALTASLLPGAFEGLIREFSAAYNAGQAPNARKLAVEALGAPLPLMVELAIAGAFLALVARRRRSNAVLAGVAVLALLPLLLFSSPANPIRSQEAFTSADSPFVRALRAQSPHRILTIGDPGWYAGMPNQPAAAGIPDMDMFSSLNLKASDELTESMRRTDPGASLIRQIAGIDIVVTFGKPCPGTAVAQVPQDRAFLCRVDSTSRPPLWLPHDAVASVVTGGGPFRPADATLDLARAVQQGRSVTVERWSSTDAELTYDAAEPGWLFIDRAWWPAWQSALDSRSIPTYRALAGQLVEVPPGRHVLTQRLFPLEAIAGLALGLLALGLAVTWTILQRRPEFSRSLARTALRGPAPGR
jgi:hypothetical protein